MSRGNVDYGKPRRMALFRDPEYGFVTVLEARCDDAERPPIDGYVRMTEWLTVTFKPLAADELVGSELMALTKMREKVVREFSGKLEVIDGRMANLRALNGPAVQS